MAVDDPDPTAEPLDLPDPVMADLAASERRRHLLDCLAAESDDRSLSVADLAACIAAHEAPDGEAEGGEDDRVPAVRDSLFQTHLPKLVETGVLDYDSMLGTVTLARPAVARQVRERPRAP